MPEQARPAPSLDNVVVILSRTTEPMNIGAACRAMKTMGLSRLRLISPLNPKGKSAHALAHGAEDILENTQVMDDVMDAIGDCQVITGTTARQRQLRKNALLTPAEMSNHIADASRDATVAILFGTERTGLTNDEADLCRYLSTVDTARTTPYRPGARAFSGRKCACGIPTAPPSCRTSASSTPCTPI